MRMATDDDVFDSAHTHCVFDLCAAFGCFIRRDNVADVLQKDKLTRFGLRQRRRNDLQVGTGDEQGQRMLTVHQAFKQTLLVTKNTVSKTVITFNELFQKYDLYGLGRRNRFSYMESSRTRLHEMGYGGVDHFHQGPWIDTYAKDYQCQRHESHRFAYSKVRKR